MDTKRLTGSSPNVRFEILAHEVGQNLAAWCWNATERLRIELAPGRYYLHVGKFVQYPLGFFLACGLPSICIMALLKPIEFRPFLDGALLRGIHVDPVLYKAYICEVHDTEWTKRRYSWAMDVAGYVKYRFGLGGAPLRLKKAERRLLRAQVCGRLPEFEDYVQSLPGPVSGSISSVG